MKSILLAMALLGSSLAFGQPQAESLELEFYTFIDKLYDDVETGYNKQISEFYNNFMEDLSLPDTDRNRNTFGRLSSLHVLMSSTSAKNGSSQGLLYVPYMWHWIDDNPRLEISKNDKLLADTPAYSTNYKNAAMVDRVPQIFLSDMVSEQPYSHPKFGEFYTFGWCSEREMAYANLMKNWGYEVKIVVQGIHCFSIVKANFDTINGEIDIYIKVDNTFAEIYGLYDNIYGDGSKLEQWYNATANKKVKARVSKEVQERIYNTIQYKQPLYFN